MHAMIYNWIKYQRFSFICLTDIKFVRATLSRAPNERKMWLCTEPWCNLCNPSLKLQNLKSKSIPMPVLFSFDWTADHRSITIAHTPRPGTRYASAFCGFSWPIFLVRGEQDSPWAFRDGKPGWVIDQRECPHVSSKWGHRNDAKWSWRLLRSCLGRAQEPWWVSWYLYCREWRC